VDSDGEFTSSDILAMAKLIDGSVKYDSDDIPLYDMNNDGKLNVLDLLILKSQIINFYKQ
jgi:hypothetical protein